MRDNEQINFGEAETFPVEDIQFSEVELPQKKAPEASVRNRAAMLALMSSDPQEIVDQYQNMLAENQAGRSEYLDSVEKNLMDNLRVRNFDVGLMQVMTDPSLTVEEKQSAIENFKNQEDDLTTAFAREALVSPSEGESVEAEEAREVSGTALFRTIESSISEEQAIINLAKKEWEEQSTILGEASGIAEWFVPGEGGLKTASLIGSLANKQEQDTPWASLMKGLLRPGASIEDLREEYSTLSPEHRLDFLRSLVDAVNDTSTVVIPKSSQMTALSTLEKLVGEYSPTEAAFDTAVNVIDIFLPVAFLARGAVRKGKQGGESLEEVIESSQLPESKAADLSLLAKASEPEVSVNAVRIKQLEAEHSAVMAETQQLAEVGSISSVKEELKGINQKLRSLEYETKQEIKRVQLSERISFKEAKARVTANNAEARTDLEMSKQRLEQFVEGNARSAGAEKRLKEIEKELEVLRKDTRTEPLKKNAIIDSLERARMNQVVGDRVPASPGSILMATNPHKARVTVKASLDANTDDVALAAFGVSKMDVLKDIALPKLTTESGIIPAKPVDITRELNRDQIVTVPDEILSHARASTAEELTTSEIAKAAENVKNDFFNATGVKVVGGMDGFRMDADGAYLKISSVYGTPEGPFLYAEDAVEQLKRSLRAYGVEDSNVTVMMKDGVNYVPVDVNKVRGKKGEYLGRLEIDHRADVLDLNGELEAISIKRNWLDSVRALVTDRVGSATRHLVDPSSIFDKTIMRGTMRAGDKAATLGKAMARLAADFTNIYNKLDKERKLAIDSYIFEANEKGIKFNPVALQNRFTTKEIEALSAFRRFWDSHFYLENLDVVRSLRAGKFGLMDNGTDRFFAKPIPKQYNINRGYDPDTGTVRQLTKEELSDLYDRGGSMSVLKSAEEINGEPITHIITDPTKNSYLRRIKDDDVALNYREGYYQVNYKSNHYIYEKGPDGAEVAVRAVAGSSRDADFAAKRMAQTTGKEYGVRGDDRVIPRDSIEYWQLNSSSGRIAQRHRGKQLEGAVGNNVVGQAQYIENPVDSAIRASNSIANRTSFRQVLDTIKERALKQYADVLPRDEFNRPRWPTTVSEISKKGITSTKQLRDARTTYEYVNFLERGYINHLDEGFKHIFLWVAESAGQASIGKKGVVGTALEGVEKAAYATVRSGITPTNVGKSFVFFNYLVANMMRQWIIQPAQALRMLVYNPAGAVSGRPQEMFARYFYDKHLNKKGAPSDFTKFVDESGMIDAIDQSSLVRGTLMEASERSNLYRRTAGRGVDAMRKGGYDLGETVNLLSHLSFVYDKYIREGKNINDARVRSEAAHLARELSYGFNIAGDFAYTHNAAGIVTQFLQVPHKAVLQYTNRSIPREVRARMFLGDLMLYGPPTALLYGLLGDDFLKDNPELKDAAVNGLMHKTLNFVASELYGEKVDVAWSDSLSPYDFGGFSKVIESVLTDGGVLEMMENTPIGGLVFKSGSRVQMAFLSSMRYLGLSEDSVTDPETLKDVASNIASVTSMWSNYQKGKLVLQTQRLMNKQGQVIAENVNSFEAVAIMLGFHPSEVSKMYEASSEIREDKNKYEDGIKSQVKTIMEVATGKTRVPVDNPQSVEVVNQLIMSTFKDDPLAMSIARKQLQFYYRDPQTGLEKAVLENVINPTLGTPIGKLIDSVQNPEDRETLRKLNEDADRSLKEYIKQQNKEK